MDTSPTLSNPSQASINNENHHKESHPNPTILTIAIVVPITTIVALILLLKLFFKHKCRSNTIEDGHGVVNFKNTNKTNSRNSISSLVAETDSKSCISGIKQPKFKGAQVFTYKELELAIRGFSKGNVIGCGGYGVVYRGTLLDGTMAAIKMLNREGKQGEREFRVEVAAIAAVCVQPESEYRPLMTDVVQSLIPLVRSQCGTCPTTPFRVQQQKGNTK